MIIFLLFVFTLALAPEHQARSGARAIGLLVGIYYLLVGLVLLLRSHLWSKRPGPVQRLIPHANGRAYGYIAAVALQLAVAIALLVSK